MDKNLAPSGYGAFLEVPKNRIRETQVRAALSANRELILPDVVVKKPLG